jgi:hypothetical protein
MNIMPDTRLVKALICRLAHFQPTPCRPSGQHVIATPRCRPTAPPYNAANAPSLRESSHPLPQSTPHLLSRHPLPPLYDSRRLLASSLRPRRILSPSPLHGTRPRLAIAPPSLPAPPSLVRSLTKPQTCAMAHPRHPRAWRGGTHGHPWTAAPTRLPCIPSGYMVHGTRTRRRARMAKGMRGMYGAPRLLWLAHPWRSDLFHGQAG